MGAPARRGAREGPDPDCVEYELEACALLYWTQTIVNGCAEFGTGCHAQSDAAGAGNGL